MRAAGKRAGNRWASRAVQAAFIIVLVGLWFFGTNYWRISPILLPNPVNVFHELADILKSGEFIDDLRITLTELAVAFAISSTTGITLPGMYLPSLSEPGTSSTQSRMPSSRPA